MIKQFTVSAILVLLVMAFCASLNAQDTKKDMKKDDKMAMSKDEMGPVKSVSCDPACGFVVKSRSEKEVISMTKIHAKMMHSKKLSDKDVKAMMKTEEEEKK